MGLSQLSATPAPAASLPPNSGTSATGNVEVTDVLGDGYSSISASDAVVSTNTPSPGWTTLKWTGQSSAQGSNVWQRTITATAANLDGNMSNAVQVKGSCASGCVYSQATDSAASTLVEVNKGQDVSAIVGQTVEFPINIVFYGSTPYENTRIVETLPSGLDYVLSGCKPDSCTGCTACGGSPVVTMGTGGSTVLTRTLGNFVGPRSLSITLRAIVADTAQNRERGDADQQGGRPLPLPGPGPDCFGHRPGRSPEDG